jgi:hypothetical protein
MAGREPLLAAWAFGEACFWFIAPDFLLMPFAIQRPGKWSRYSLIAWCASFVGGSLYFLFCSVQLPLAESILAHTPFVTPRMLETISGLYDRQGYWGALGQSWSFMSFKIWTFEAVRHHFSWWIYFPVVMFSRVFRLFVVTWVVSRLSPYVEPLWSWRPALSWTLYTAAFLVMLIVMER